MPFSSGFKWTLAGLGVLALAVILGPDAVDTAVTDVVDTVTGEEPVADDGGPSYDTKTRKILNGLKDAFRAKVEALIAAAWAAGYKIQLESGARSIEKQTALYNAAQAGKNGGRPAAKPGHSAHEYGMAVDIRLSGHSATKSDSVWGKIGPIGERLGLKWGGRFSRWDGIHFEDPTASALVANGTLNPSNAITDADLRAMDAVV